MKRPTLALLLPLLAFVIHCKVTECYKSELEITPAPPEEVTTKKSSWFGGIKNFFRSDTSTTTTTTIAPPPRPAEHPTVKPSGFANTASSGSVGAPAQKPPPLVIPHAPLMPLGPRPDTPPSSPLGGNQQQPPQWPGAGLPNPVPTHTSQQQLHGTQNIPGARPSVAGGASPGTPNLPPGFAPYRPSKGTQPSGFDLSYAGGSAGGQGQHVGRPGSGLAPLTSSTSTTTTTTTQKPTSSKPTQISDANIDLRGGFSSPTPTPTPMANRPQSHHQPDFPVLPTPRRPAVKEDFPALPTPKSPGSASPTPASPLRPSSPTAWQNPLPTLTTPAIGAHTPTLPVRPGLSPTPAKPMLPANNDGNTHGVSFVPHTPGSTTVRPGYPSSGNSVATDDEIRQLTEQLYTKETNSQLNLIQVNVQGKTRSIDSGDEAPQPLFSVDSKALESNTIAKLKLLFNNYEEDTLVNEHVTPNEHKEENEFLDAVMATSVMRQAMLFLQQKDLVTPDPKTHRDLVKELWFTQYSRGQGKIGSSGFEHVFVHEVKNGTIIGFHNWVYVNEEELAGRFDYKGYMNQLDLGTKGKVMKIRFSYNGLNKPVDTMFIGTSPELELALYTVCFKLRPDRTCPVSLGNSRFGIVTYSWRYRGKNLIGSAYPEI